MDISTSPASNQTKPEGALWTVRNQNNPFQPKCSINELSTEILEHIFKLGVEMEAEGEEGKEDDDGWEDISDDNSDDDDMSDSSTNNAGSGERPLFILISHVCRHWRDVALNLHVFWTSIDFDNFDSDMTVQLAKAKVFIDRAQGLPLKVYIDCILHEDTDKESPYNQMNQTRKQIVDGTSKPDPFLSLTHILDLVEPEVYHWGELNFHFSTYRYVQSLLSRLHKLPSAPLLKEFHLFHHEDCDFFEFFCGNDKTYYFPFHGNAPLLESAIFWGVHIDWDKSLSFLHGLREFELSYHAKDVLPSYNTFIQIIKNSPNLRSLSLSVSGPALAKGAQFDDEGQWGPEPIEIPSLHYLMLHSQEPQYASALIQHFYFPNLRGLSLDFKEEDYTSFARKLLVPVKGRSKTILSGLKTLKISGLPCDAATVEAILEQLMELKVLYLKCFGSEEMVFFKKLINPSAGRKKQGKTQINTGENTLSKIFCPVLETLAIIPVRSESEIKTLVRARKAGGAPLKTLRLSYGNGITIKMEEWLWNHVEVVEFFEPQDEVLAVQNGCLLL